MTPPSIAVTSPTTGSKSDEGLFVRDGYEAEEEEEVVKKAVVEEVFEEEYDDEDEDTPKTTHKDESANSASPAATTAAAADSAVMEETIQFKQVAVSQRLSCGIALNNSDLICWGQKNSYEAMPMHVRGPFKQVSMGKFGVCVITEDGKHPLLSPTRKEITATTTAEEATAEELPGPSLLCWGTASHLLDASIKVNPIGWDQVKIANAVACAVSLHSEVLCWGMTSKAMLAIPENLIIA